MSEEAYFDSKLHEQTYHLFSVDKDGLSRTDLCEVRRESSSAQQPFMHAVEKGDQEVNREPVSPLERRSRRSL